MKNGLYKEPKKLFTTKCSKCGNECQVPFKPIEGKPVHCKNCFIYYRRGK